MEPDRAGMNGYSGFTAIDNGTLQIGNGGAFGTLGAGIFTISGGTNWR